MLPQRRLLTRDATQFKLVAIDASPGLGRSYEKMKDVVRADEARISSVPVTASYLLVLHRISAKL